MGRFVNPDNSAFQVALNSPIYVDKTGLLEYTNSVLNTTEAYICNCRPRRFGKSYAANMLAAYYSKGCNSEEMFSEVFQINFWVLLIETSLFLGSTKVTCENKYNEYEKNNKSAVK